MAQMKRETLVRKMLQDPGAVREFLNACSNKNLAMWFPDHTIEVKTKVVHNMMTGLPVTIPVNTPISCDPSSETYWSM